MPVYIFLYLYELPRLTLYIDDYSRLVYMLVVLNNCNLINYQYIFQYNHLFLVTSFHEMIKK